MADVNITESVRPSALPPVHRPQLSTVSRLSLSALVRVPPSCHPALLQPVCSHPSQIHPIPFQWNRMFRHHHHRHCFPSGICAEPTGLLATVPPVRGCRMRCKSIGQHPQLREDDNLTLPRLFTGSDYNLSRNPLQVSVATNHHLLYHCSVSYRHQTTNNL